MNIKIKKLLINQKGGSLIEVVASIIIITIILISFFGLFVQSNKTENSSEQIIDATYVAQVEMENIYQLSKYYTVNNLVEGLSSIGYSVSEELNNTYTKVLGNYYIKLRIRDYSSDTLINTIVEVYEGDVLKSKMENYYSWKVK